MRKPRSKPGGKWTFVPDKDRTPEEVQADAENFAFGQAGIQSLFSKSFADRCKVVEQVQDYLPGNNKVPEGGAWILIKNSPPTEYTVPPLSIWYAEPWPMGDGNRITYRVKVVTPKGELGVFPREYSLIGDPGKYFQFIGEGMEAKFFGSEEGIPRDKLFYLRSRGISKTDAIIMLIGSIKAHGVMWLESSPEVAEHFGKQFPDAKRLATV